MNAEDVIMIIKKGLDNNEKIDLTSPNMYDPIELQNKVSFAIMENTIDGMYKKFMVTVEDLRK